MTLIEEPPATQAPTRPHLDPERVAPARRYDVPTRWDLSDLLPEPTEAVISERLARMWESVEAFEGERERLRGDMEPQELLDLLRRYEALDQQIAVLAGYGSLWFSTDTHNAAALGYRNRIRQLVAEADNRTLFFSLWWKALADEEAERLLPTAELDATPQELQDFRYYLLELRRFSPYTLDERSEQLLNLKNANGIEALVTLYQMLANRLEFHLEAGGETTTLTDDEMRSRFYSPDPDLRARCYVELHRVYRNESSVLAQIYANRVRDWYTEYVKLRGVPSPISIRNLANDVPDAAVETLLAVVKDNAPLFQEYFRLKAGFLGREKMRRYDVYASLATSTETVAYGDAVATVLETFYGFHPTLGQLAERLFEVGHVDSETRKNKRGGAFCATVTPKYTPWMMFTYTGRLRDVATLAHELGHAVHNQMASGHSLLTQHPSLPLAETASVFAEMMITDRLLRSQSDPVTRRELLAAALDDIYATVLRQSYFVLFELAAHRAVLDNANADELCELYFANLHEQFGDSLDVSDDFRYEWLAIPHMFSTPFYCYAYSFGQLLVLALYRRYQQEGEAFKPGYLKLLSYGGSASPAKMLAEMGMDITDPAFWQSGFEVVRGLLDELKGL
jgi:oligoendopeptidase F